LSACDLSDPLSPLHRGLSTLLKPLFSLADKPVVQRSTLITGALLAFGGATLATVGFWVSGGLDFLSAASPAGTVATYRAGREVASASLPPVPVGLSGTADYTIRKTVPEVRLQFTVADERGRLVPDIRQADLRILDDHLPVPRIQQFDTTRDLPLRLGLVLDVSESMKKVMEQEKAVALSFLHNVLRPDLDRAFVMSFGDGNQVLQDNTNQLADLAGAVQRARQPGNGTEFFDAMYAACAEQWREPEANVHRVVLVISDGEDTGSMHGLGDVVEAAQRREIQVYALNVHLKKGRYPGDRILQRVADETGGRFFVADSPRQADAIFRQLEQELRTQYYVSFRPAQEKPGYHLLQLELDTPQKLLVHARRGYYVAN
jgi:VWFA-related protein